ncbi:MAG: hypothetical protein FJZ00_06850, partial [Candidatus Sericytochromatia bacterium]|nr:hypothetical protein [Candidatus Tanganyikabacteria bacterium]
MIRARRIAAILAAALGVQACAYRQLRYELVAEDPPPGGGGTQRARVVDKAENRPYRAESVDWRYRGVVAAGPSPGLYAATGPGTGSIEATFLTPDGTRSITIAIAVRPRPGLTRRPSPAPPTPEPAPEPPQLAIAT